MEIKSARNGRQREIGRERQRETKGNYNFPSAVRVPTNLFIIQKPFKEFHDRRKGEHAAATLTFLHIHSRKRTKGGCSKGMYAIADFFKGSDLVDRRERERERVDFL